MIHRVARRALSIAARTAGRPAARLADIQATARLAPLSQSYLAWSPVAMRPSGVTTILDDIILRRRTAVVECGAGITTFYIARLLSQRGGHLWSIEHDPGWAALVETEIEREGLGASVSVVHAPLDNGDAGGWYSREALTLALDGLRFDLVVVDGPPASDRALSTARYPAVPFFADRLASDWTIVLDDIRRSGEESVVRRWERELGTRFERRLIRGGVAVAYAGAGPRG